MVLNGASTAFYYRAEPGAKLSFTFNHTGTEPEQFLFTENGGDLYNFRIPEEICEIYDEMLRIG